MKAVWTSSRWSQFLFATFLSASISLLNQQPALRAQAKVWNFDKDAPQSLPKGWTSVLSGQGGKGKWVTLADPTAPSQPNVLAQTTKDIGDYRFPVAILEDATYQDPNLSVQFKTVFGRVDQCAGLVWRYMDPKNYYVVRANALEDNVVVYKMENGKRSHLRPKGSTGRGYGVKIRVSQNTWNKLGIKATGSVFIISFNGQKLYEVEDNTFSEAGKVGLWTKADSVTYFDNFSVIGNKN
jgi:hypothetical protein